MNLSKDFEQINFNPFNFERLHDLLLNCSNSFNVICVTETWSTDNDIKNNSNFHLPSFDFIHQERKTGKEGGRHSNIYIYI